MSQPAIANPAHPEVRAALDLFAAWIEYRLASWRHSSSDRTGWRRP